MCFKKHLQSKSHAEAVEAVVKLPKTTNNVGEQLSRAHRVDKEQARDMLLLILSSICFLARQGLALRGDGSDASANLIQLLRLRAEDKPQVLQWLLGLYCLSAIDAQSIVEVMKDAFLRFQIPMAKLRGQCYDGCSTMAGAKAGVAVKIEEMEPRAVFTHCYGHALNLGVNDTIKHSPAMKDCLDTIFELVGQVLAKARDHAA